MNIQQSRFTVHVRPHSQHPSVEKLDAFTFRISVHAPARDGRANEAVIRALAKTLRLAPSRLRLVSGQKSKTKIIERL